MWRPRTTLVTLKARKGALRMAQGVEAMRGGETGQCSRCGIVMGEAESRAGKTLCARCRAGDDHVAWLEARQKARAIRDAPLPNPVCIMCGRPFLRDRFGTQVACTACMMRDVVAAEARPVERGPGRALWRVAIAVAVIGVLAGVCAGVGLILGGG